MNPLVNIGIFLVIAGMVVVGAVMLSAALASRRRQQNIGDEEPVIPVNLASVNDAVLVAGLGGQISFANDVAREWLFVDSNAPDLWQIAQRVTPPESFLELFAAEGQATFAAGDRSIEATSHRIAMGDGNGHGGAQFIVVMREEAPLPRLDREERGSTRALQVMGEITQNINASLHLPVVLDATLEGVNRVLHADAGQITLWEQEQERLIPQQRSGPDQYTTAITPDLNFNVDDGFAGWIARKRRSLLITDTGSGDLEASPNTRAGEGDFKSYLGVPLTVRNRFIGTLELFSNSIGGFEREDQALLELIAEQAASAIENARQYSSQAERVVELSGLQKIAQAISVLRDPYQLFAQLGARVAELMQTESAGVLLYDKDQEKLVAQKPIHGVPDGLATDYQIPLEKGSPARSLWEDVNFWFTNNIEEDKLVAELGLGMLAELADVKSTAMAKMALGEDKIGILQVSNKITGAPFTMEDIRLLQIYANQAAIVVESARLYSEEQSRVAELRGLQQITQALSAFTNPDELYAQLTEQIASLMLVDVCGVLLYDADNDILNARKPFFGMTDDITDTYQISLKRAPARELWREYELYESNHVLTDDRIDALGVRDVARGGGLRTLMYAPLSAGGRRFGMLQVSNKSDGSEFNDSDKRLLTIFAGQAAALLDNARLYQDTDATLRKRAAELRSVSRISRELNATLELNRILEVIAAEALRAEGARWGNLVMFQWDASGSDVTETMRFGTDTGDEARILERACARSGETLVVDDFKKLPHYPSPLPDARAALVVPIQFEGKVVGVISLYSNRPGGLGTNAAEYVQALSSQATIAVTNATRHAEQLERSELLRRRADQMSQIFELGRAFRTDQSIDETLEAVARAIKESVGFDIVLISSLDMAGQALRHVTQTGLPGEAAKKLVDKVVPWETVQRYLSDEYRTSGSYLIPRADSKKLVTALGLAGTTEHLGGNGDKTKWQPGDVLLVPLRSKEDEIIGLMTVDQPRDGALPNRNTVELLEIFANQAAISLENTRLYTSVESRAGDLQKGLADLEKSYQELDKLSQEMITKDAELSQVNELLNLRAQRLLALHRVMESVDATRGPGMVLRDIAASVVQEMDIDQCLIALETDEGALSEEARHLVIVAAEGRLPKTFDPFAFLSGEDPLSVAHSTDKPVLFAPGGVKGKMGEAARAIGVQTFVAMPMHLDAGTNGVLMVGSTRPGAAFDDDDRDLFALLASQIVVEFENARLYQVVQQEAATAASERDRLQQLHVITTALQQTRELDDRLAVIARGIRSVGYNKVAVALMDPVSMVPGTIITAGYTPEEEEQLAAQHFSGGAWSKRFEDPQFGTLRLGSSYFLPAEHPWVQANIPGSADEATPDGDPTHWRGGDHLYMPMYAGSDIIGLISLRDPLNGQRPTSASLRPLELFVQQAASALENARLYQSTVELQSYREAIVESIQQGIVVTNEHGRVETINTFLKEHYGWTSEIIGKNLFDASGTISDLSLAKDFTQVIMSGQPVERAVQYPIKGEFRPINVYMYPRFDETRDVNGVVILLEDVSQRARLEADIALRGQQLAALSDVSRQITATLSVNDVVNSALSQANQVIQYDRVALWLRSFEGDNLEVAGTRGFEQNEKMTDHMVVIDQSPLFEEIVIGQEPLLADGGPALAVPQGADSREMKSWLGAPLVSGGIVVGAVVFEQLDANSYAPADVQVSAAFANQVAVAIENARLFEEAAERATELHSRTRRLTLLNRISSTLGTSLDQNSILQNVLNELAQALDAVQGGVFMFDSEAEHAKMTLQYPSEPDGTVETITLPLKDSLLIERLRETRAPVAIRDVESDKLTASMKEALAQRKVKSALFVPVMVGSTVTGILTIETDQEVRDFESEQIELAQTIMNQAAVAIQNAQLFNETVVRRAELGILLEAGRIASSSLDLDTVVSSAARYFVRSLAADGCSIALLDKGRDALISLIEFDAPSGARPVTPDDHRYRLSDYPVTAGVINARTTINVDAHSPDITVMEGKRLADRHMAAALLIPLVARDETIGLVEVWNAEPRKFNARETDLAKALATSIASAMENARLHDETQHRLEELEVINELSHALSQTISSEDLYQILQTQISRLLDTKSMTVARRDPITGQITFPLAVREKLRIEIEPIGYGADLYSYVIETGQSMHIMRDVAAKLNELGVDHIEPDLKSFLGVPLIAGEQVVGVLAVEDYEKENAFSATDLRVLGPIAAQVAVSIENTRLYSELEQRLSETTTLQEVSRVVNSALDLHEIFDRVVVELANAFKFPLIGLYTLEGSELVLQSHFGLDPEEARRLSRLSVEAGIVGRAAINGVPQFVQDVSRDADYIPVKGWVRSEIAVPIVSDTEVLGVLNVQSGIENPVDENDLNLLRTFATQVATAVANARLFTQMVNLSEELERRVDDRTRELKEERDRIDTLYRIAVELTASLDLDRVLNRALELVGEAVGAEHGSLFLIDPLSDRLIWRAVMSGHEILPPGGRQIAMTRHEGMAGWVMDNRRSVRVDNVQADVRWVNASGTEHNRSLLGAPLVANEEVLGCIFFTSDVEAAFHDGHVRLVEAAANQVANSINNAELYRLIRDQAERLGVMLRSQQTEAAKSQAILESVADGVMVADQAGEIILFNAAAERILELRRSEVLGRSSSELSGLYGSASEKWNEMLFEWAMDPASHAGEYFSEQLEIGSKVVAVNVSPVLHGDEFLGVVSVFRDISREVAADRIKSEFVATVSHELRTPMTSIKGYADLLLLGAAGEISPEQRRFLEIVKNNADRLSLLVNDLLDISRIEQGGVDLDVRAVDLRSVVNDVVESVKGRRDSEKRSLEFVMEADDNVQDIYADRDRINQIIQNLISNAYNYTSDGGTITIKISSTGDGAQVDVADTGIGIPADVQSRVFERFFRGEDPMVMRTAGTGLGLAITQHLVNMHRGKVWFESEEGVGTTFSVWLPYLVPSSGATR